MNVISLEIPFFFSLLLRKKQTNPTIIIVSLKNYIKFILFQSKNLNF